MADIGTAYVRVAPNMQGIQGKIASGFKGAAGPATAALGSEVNSHSGPFQKAIGGLGKAAKVGGIAIATGLAAGIAGLVTITSKAVMAQAELEQQIGGSEAVFGKYAKTIQEKAKTAFETAGLSQQEFLQGANKMGSLFQGAGFDVQKSMSMSSESMQRASDIASIMGISTTSALEAVTGMAKGNFTMMDNLGVAMNDTAIGAYAASKGINKSTAAMSIQEKVGLAQQMFMEKTAKYAGNYAKENETLAGSLNTTKKAFDNLLAGQGDASEFIDSLLNTIDIAIPQIVAMLPKIVEGIGATLTALVPAIEKALPVLVPALITAVTKLLNALVTAMPTIVQVLVTALPTLITAFVQLFLAILKALPQIIQIISAALPQIIDAIVTGLTSPASIQAIILGSIQLLIAIIKAIPVIVSALAKAIPTIVKNIIATLTSSQFIAAMFRAGVQLLQAVVGGIGSMIASVARMAGSVISTIAKTLAPSNLVRIGVDVVKGLWNGIESMGGWMKDKIVGWVKDKIPGPVKKALGISSPSKLFATFGKYIGAGLINGLSSKASEVKKQASELANKAIAGATESLKALKEKYSSLVSSIASSIKQSTGVLNVSNFTGAADFVTVLQKQLVAVKKFRNDIEMLRKRGLSSKVLAEIAGAGLDKGGQIAATLATTDKATIKSINSLTSSISANATSVGKVAGGAMYGAGLDTMSGLVRGMKAKRGAVISLIARLGDDMKRTLKRKLGISSPSKAFAELGNEIGAGLAKGIADTTKLVTSSVNGMADAALNTVDPAVGSDFAFGAASATPAGGNNIVTSTTNIEKVVLGDDSAVKEFFRQANQDTMRVGMGLTPVQGAQQ